MLVLEATDELQGVRDDDYHWAETGELEHLPALDCSSPTCGCMRGFAGLRSHRATTTAKVVDRPWLTIEDLCRQLATSLHDGGWIDANDPSDIVVAAMAEEIVELANNFGRHGPGAIIEREGDMLAHRLPPGTEPLDPRLLDLLRRGHDE